MIAAPADATAVARTAAPETGDELDDRLRASVELRNRKSSEREERAAQLDAERAEADAELAARRQEAERRRAEALARGGKP